MLCSAAPAQNCELDAVDASVPGGAQRIATLEQSDLDPGTDR